MPYRDDPPHRFSQIVLILFYKQGEKLFPFNLSK